MTFSQFIMDRVTTAVFTTLCDPGEIKDGKDSSILSPAAFTKSAVDVLDELISEKAIEQEKDNIEILHQAVADRREKLRAEGLVDPWGVPTNTNHPVHLEGNEYSQGGCGYWCAQASQKAPTHSGISI